MSEPMVSALFAAREYVHRGWAPIPIPPRDKAPAIRDWQNLRLSEDDLPNAFPRTDANIGVLMGIPSNGLVDIDLDTPEARRLAPALLPSTEAVFGRRSSPASHWLFAVTDDVRSTRFQDVSASSGERAVLLELRSTGAQTLLPPSVHPSGEPVEWRSSGRPTEVAATELRVATATLAAATLLARRWPEGSRHDAALALAGGLARANWTPDSVQTFVLAVAEAAGDDELEDRLRAVRSTLEAHRTGTNHTGWPRLATVLGEATVAQVRRWLGIRDAPEPLDLSNRAPLLAPVPPFPVEALPPLAREFVVAGAAALGCPPDFIAPHLFAFTGAVAGASRRLRLKQGYEVTPIFWVGVVGRPGTVKSPALSYVRGPVETIQKDAWSQYLRTVEGWEQEKQAERGPKPQPEHYFATDTTTEAVASALMRSRGIAVIHDELAGWVNSFDAYRKGGDRQTWLSSWSGTPLKPNRKTGDPIFVPDPVVAVLGGIQPDVLAGLNGEAARDDGFIPRLLLTWPDAEPSPWTDEVVPPGLIDRMTEQLRRLRLPGDVICVTSLEPGALGSWVQWFNENRTLVARSTGLSAGWGAKAPVHLARIALVLHLLAAPPTRLGEPEPLLTRATMDDAIQVVEYFRAHLDRILPAFGASGPGGRAGLAARIRRALSRPAGEWVGRADLAARLGGHEPADTVSEALETLFASGDVDRLTQSTGGRPREAWRLLTLRPSSSPPSYGRFEDASIADGAAGERDKGYPDPGPAEPAPQSALPRIHVVTSPTGLHRSDPSPGWERWEEGG